MQMIKKSYFKILQAINNNIGIRLNELIRKSNTSVATSKIAINKLLDNNIIKEEIIRCEKKIVLKNFYPNLNSEEGKLVFSIIEIEKRDKFFRKYKELVGPFKDLTEHLKEAEIVLI